MSRLPGLSSTINLTMPSNFVLPVVDLPVGQCRRIRNGAAEAEIAPAYWDAKHLKIEGPDTRKLAQ